MSLRAFLAIFICGLFLFVKYIAQLFPSLISLDLIHEYALSGASLAVLASSYYYSYSIMQIVAGYLIDKFDMRFPAFLSILVVALSMLVFPHTHNFFMMCTYRALMGAGASFATVLYMKCAASFASPRMFGIISSILATLAMLGAAFSSTPVSYLFNLMGWREGITTIAIASIILAILSLFCISSKYAPNYITNQSLNISDIKKVVVSKINWMLLLYCGLSFSPVAILGGLWGIPFLAFKLQISEVKASFVITLMFLSLGVGAPIWALIIARLKNYYNLLHFANLVCFLLMVLIVYSSFSYQLNLILFCLLGFFVGAFMTGFQICRHHNHIAIIGMAVAFINTGEGILGSILEPGIGYLLDLFKIHNNFTLIGYKISLSLLPACFILAGISLKLLKYLQSKEIKTA